MRHLLRKIKCYFSGHSYKEHQHPKHHSVYQCSRCHQFKSGPVVQSDELEIYVFEDGSAIEAHYEKPPSI